jgi:uncharacterized protein YcnI
MTIARIAVLIFAALSLTPLDAARAHIAFTNPEAKSDAYYGGALRVGHGCGNSPTTAITVSLPAGIDAARPQPKSGWTIEIEREPMPAPQGEDSIGTPADRVKSITWRGQLPNEHFDEFGLSMRIPQTPGPLYFLTVQTCESGENAWTEIPAPDQSWGSLAHPAPVLTIIGAPPMAPAAPTAAGQHDH